MVERNEFTTIEDGDQLNEGYFNGIYSRLGDLTTPKVEVEETAVTFTGGTDDDLLGSSDTSGTISYTRQLPDSAYKYYDLSENLGTATIKFNDYIATVVDECNDSSVNATWSTTGSGGSGSESTSENTERLQFICTASGATRTSFLLWDEDFGTTQQSIITSAEVLDSGDSGGSFEIQLYDGTSSVNIFSESLSLGEDIANTLYIIQVIDANEVNLLRISSSGIVTITRGIDTSSLSATRKVRYKLTSLNVNSGTTTLNLFYLRQSTGSETTSVSELVSFDGGTNYTVKSNNLVYEDTNTGDNLHVKSTATIAAGEVYHVWGYALKAV